MPRQNVKSDDVTLQDCFDKLSEIFYGSRAYPNEPIVKPRLSGWVIDRFDKIIVGASKLAKQKNSSLAEPTSEDIKELTNIFVAVDNLNPDDEDQAWVLKQFDDQKLKMIDWWGKFVNADEADAAQSAHNASIRGDAERRSAERSTAAAYAQYTRDPEKLTEGMIRTYIRSYLRSQLL